MSSKSDRVHATVAAIYEAALRPACWPSALDKFRCLLDGAASVMFLQDAANGEIPFWLGVGTEEGEDEYVREINKINPRVKFAMTHEPGTMVWDYRVMPEAAMKRDPFYDWLSRVHDYRYFVGCRLFEDGSRSALVGIDWATKHGHADKPDIELFQLIRPHIEQALRITIAGQQAEAQTSALETSAHLLDCGIVVLNPSGRVVFINAFADEILSRDDGLTVSDGYLVAAKSADRRTLDGLVAAALSSDDVPKAASALLPRKSAGPPYAVSVTRVPLEPYTFLAREACVVILIRDSAVRTLSLDVLRSLYGLTARESELAALLQRGCPPIEAAERLGITVNTARVHLKSIFLKTGARSQVELARLLMGLPPDMPSQEP